MPPANTGNDKTSKIAVKNTVQTNRGICSQVMWGSRRLITVHRKLIDLPIEETPAMCSLKIARSTLIPGWPIKALIGG